jgi:cytochrome c-type biogenesis protein CcmH/NrfF
MNLAVYLLPVVLLIGGATLIVVMVKRWTSVKPTETEAETQTETQTETEALR